MRTILRTLALRCQGRPRPPGRVAVGRARLCAMAFATLYGPGARFYDRFTRWLFAGEWRRWQETIVPLLPDRGTVVELGGGTGALARSWATAERRWVVVERSPAMLAVAGRALRTSPAMLIRADARALPLAGQEADVVIATFPADFIVEPATWGEIARVLKPAGRYAIVASGRLLPDGASNRWRSVLLRVAYGGQEDRSAPPVLSPVPPSLRPADWQWVPTAHGEALVLTGRKSSARRPVDPTRSEGSGQVLGPCCPEP